MLLTLIFALMTVPSNPADLARAIAKGQDDEVIASLRKHLDWLTPENKRDSPLHVAAEHGRHKIVEAALAMGVDVDLPDLRGRTALFDLLHSFDLPSGWKPTLALLLKAGADPNHLDIYGASPLLAMFGVGSYRNQVLEPTRLEKADVEELMVMMAMMEKAGADLWLKNGKGDDLLTLSIQWCIRPMIPFLIKKRPQGASPQRLNEALVKTAILAKRYREAMIPVRVDMVRLLIEAGAQKEAANQSLILAAHWRDPALLKALLDHGAVLAEARDAHGLSVLQSAFRLYRPKDDPVIGFLLEQGADVAYRDKQGETALHYAVKNASFSWIDVLLEKGAPFDDDGKGAPLLAVATDHPNFEMVIYLIGKGAKWDGREVNGRRYADQFLNPEVSRNSPMNIFLHALIRWRAGERSHLQKFASLVFDPRADIEARRRWALYLLEAAPATMAKGYVDLLDDPDEVLGKLAHAMLRRLAFQYAEGDVPKGPQAGAWRTWLNAHRKALPAVVDDQVIRAGIGAQEAGVSIASLVEGEGGQKAGLRKGDKILAVDDVPVESFKRRTVAIDWLLTGARGSQVTVTIARKGEPDHLRFQVVRTRLVAE